MIKNRKQILGWVFCMLMCIVAGCDKDDAPVGEVANQGSEYEYRPFVVEGKRWECTDWSWGAPENKKTSTYTIKGDTLINGLPCKKLYRGSKLDYCLYEENKKVYIVQSDKLSLLFDFGLEVGDTIINFNGRGTFKVSVLRVDTIMNSQRQPFRRLLIRTGLVNDEGRYIGKQYYCDLYWIEGVGSSRCPEDSYFWYNGGWELPGMHMDTCYENGECIMTYDEIMINSYYMDLNEGILMYTGKTVDNHSESDEYVPLVKAGKVWVYKSIYGLSGLKEFFSGDTIINGKSYMKLYRQYEMESYVHYVAALREQDKKVYCVLPSETEEWLAYDFGLTVGEEFESPEGLPWLKKKGKATKAVLTSISSYELDDASCRMLNFDVYQNPYNYPNCTGWIEGVGALNDPVYAWIRYYMVVNPKDGPTGGPHYYYRDLYYCEDNGKLLYKSNLWLN